MGATYFANALSATRNTLDIDWAKLEEAWEAMPERDNSDEEVARGIEWANTIHGRRVQGSGGDTAGTEAVLRPRQEDIDIASLQHRRVPNEQE